MFKLTDKLKAYAEEKLGVAKGAADSEYQAAINKGLADGKISGKEYAELTAEKAPTPREMIAAAVKDGIAEGMKAAAPAPATTVLAPAPTPEKQTTTATGATKGMNGGANPQSVIGQADPNITVRSHSDKYNKNRIVGKHIKTGEPVMLAGTPIEHYSQLELAKAGVWMRFRALRQGVSCRGLDEHERALLNEMLAEDEFYKDVGDDVPHEIVSFKGKAVANGDYVKALIDDSGGGTSGGTALVPVWFDDAIITFPLLNSEIMPYVDISEVPRSSRIQAASHGNPTISWGSTEGSAFSLFTTTGIAAQIDTTIFPVVLGFEIGLDWLSDTPVNAGNIVMQNIGQAALTEMDNVIANGNGTNRPQGIFNASGLVTVNSINGAGGPLRVEDAENLTGTGQPETNTHVLGRFRPVATPRAALWTAYGNPFDTATPQAEASVSFIGTFRRPLTQPAVKWALYSVGWDTGTPQEEAAISFVSRFSPPRVPLAVRFYVGELDRTASGPVGLQADPNVHAVVGHFQPPTTPRAAVWTQFQNTSLDTGVPVTETNVDFVGTFRPTFTPRAALRLLFSGVLAEKIVLGPFCVDAVGLYAASSTVAAAAATADVAAFAADTWTITFAADVEATGYAAQAQVGVGAADPGAAAQSADAAGAENSAKATGAAAAASTTAGESSAENEADASSADAQDKAPDCGS